MTSFVVFLLLAEILIVSLLLGTDGSPLSCASLAADRLHVESTPSSTCLRGIVQGTTLYNRSETRDPVTGNLLSLDEGVLDIALPFPVRWFNEFYQGSAFVGSNSYITFGGSKIVSYDFGAFNPPFPSVLIGSQDMTLQLLTVAQVPQGWLVHYEGAQFQPNFNFDEIDPVTEIFLHNSTMVWELLFLSTGGLHLCTGMLQHDTSQAISAISNQKSSSFAGNFKIEPNFLYKFVTSCAATNRVSLSTPIASVSAIQLNVMLFVTLQNASDVDTWTITLRGAGFSCPLNSIVSLISSPPQLSTVGTAKIVASNSSSPVLVISGILGTINGSIILAFGVPGASTPYQPQGAFSDMTFAVHERSGRLVTSGGDVHMDAILPCISLDKALLLELSLPVIKQSQARLQLTISVKPESIIFRQYNPTTLVITVSGEGWWFDAASVVVDNVICGDPWVPIASRITALQNKASVIVIDFDPNSPGVISSLSNMLLRIFPVTTPHFVQDSLSDIKCAFLNARGSVLAAGNGGSLDAIFASTMGSFAPSISFSTPLKSVPDSTLTIKLTPTFRANFASVQYLALPAAGPAIIITISGDGFTLFDNTPVTFLLPVGASGVASVDSSNPMFPVLKVTMSSGTFESGWPIWFEIAPVSTPSFEQPFFSNVSSAIYGVETIYKDCMDQSNDVIVSSSVSGTIDSIVGGMGPDQPSIRHVIVNGIAAIVASFTPSASLPANSKVLITLVGLGITCAKFTPVVFASPNFVTLGSASFISDPLISVLAVSIPGAISADANVSFSLSPVFASFSSSSTLSSVRASVTDQNHRVLVASVSGVFAASMSAALTVRDRIISAANGTIILNAEVLAGGANCNNVIHETMPVRELGSLVVLKSSGSGTVIDCSGTNMRCLIVYRSSISIMSVTFKGGSSSVFVQSSTLKLIRELYQAFDDVTKGVTRHSESFSPLRTPVSSSYAARKAHPGNSFDIPTASHEATTYRGSTQSRHRPSKSSHTTRRDKVYRPIGIAAKRRKLLQSPMFLSAIFKLDQESCGGCILVDAADHNATLFDVTFSDCSAVYGGGGFFNVSSFKATHGLALNNIARQGGGFFVLSELESIMRSFSFLNNTVATFLPSKYEYTLESSFGRFSLLPDRSAAAGGGVWFQRLNIAENCTFLDNTAIGASPSDVGWCLSCNEMSGSHALGSGMFVLEARRASLSDLVFVRSRQLCAGWCVSGGALFVGIVSGGIVMERFFFNQVVSTAVASQWSLCQDRLCFGPSVALGSCVVIVDMASKSLSILRNVHAENISVRAVGSIFGGCIFILQNFSNVVASNISFSNTILIVTGSDTNAIFGLLGANSVFNSSISLISTRNASLACIGRVERGVSSSKGIYGGVLYLKNTAEIQIFGFVTLDTRLQSSSSIYGGVICFETSSFKANVVGISTINISVGVVLKNNGLSKIVLGRCYGGVFYIGQSSDTQFSNSVTKDMHMYCSASEIGCTTKNCDCLVTGGVFFITTSQNNEFSQLLARNVMMSCNSLIIRTQRPGPDFSCSTGGGLLSIDQATNTSVYELTSFNCSIACSGALCQAVGVVLRFSLAKVVKVSGITSENSSLSCNGEKCYCLGGLLYISDLPKTFSNTDCLNISRSSFSDVKSDTVSVKCMGESCFVMGGIGYFDEAFCLTVKTFLSLNSKISSLGNNSKAAGAILAVAASGSSLYTNLRTIQSTVSCHGDFSQAFGGAVTILSGSVTINDCFFSQSTVKCSGYECVSIGGFMSLVSSLVSNPDFITRISVNSSFFSLGNVSCDGVGCYASGGALASAKSFNASKWLRTPNPSRDTTQSPPDILISIQSCNFANNSVSSFSRAASAGGGALSLRSSVATIFDCMFLGNSIQTGNLTAFAGGGAVHVSNAGCQLIAQGCTFSFNDASSVGQGGALLAALGATFVGSKLTFSNNGADKGGAILIDASVANISTSKIQNNVAVTSGGGLFCSSNQEIGLYFQMKVTSKSLISLQDVSIESNIITKSQDGEVGADVFVIGSVVFAADKASKVSMSGRFDRDVTSAVVSVVTDSPSILLKTACLSGSMLRIAPTSLSNMVSVYTPPSDASMNASKCFPACLEVPAYQSYVAASGFLASCTPCPRGTYNLGASSSTSDIVSSFCFECPFGADCLGANNVRAQASYWGWKVSATALPTEFLLLPEGYGCKENECQDINSCGGNHTSVLCGGCKSGFSAAFFTSDCVSDDECATWKLWVLICFAFLYALFYSVFFRYGRGRGTAVPTVMSHPMNNLTVKTSSIIEINEYQRSRFHVLMWYYQLVGLLLSMPNPLPLVDGDAIILNIIGLAFGTAPISQVLNLPTFVFCTAKGSTSADILLFNILFYLLWTAVMVALTFERIWLPVYRLIRSFFDIAPTYWENYERAAEAMAVWGPGGKVLAVFLAVKWTIQGLNWATVKGGAYRFLVNLGHRAKSALCKFLFVISFKQCEFGSQTASSLKTETSKRPDKHPPELRGRAWIDFGVTAYSALLSLMIQCTTCVTVSGYQNQGSALPELRWFYDGRIVCFSDSGERSGVWQIAALVAVLLLTAMPLTVAMYMRRSMMKPEHLHNTFETSALPAYLEQFNAANRHWFTIMFYQRITLSFVIFYTISLNAPFVRGILAWFVCFIVLALDVVYKPYSSPDLQRLSSVCCFLLVALSSVLLRSQTLLSSGRAINFFPKNPSRTAKELPLDVQISLVVVFSCLLMPMVLLLNPFGFLRSFASLTKRYLVRACQRMRIFDQRASDREWPSSQEPVETLRAPVGLESARGDDSDVAASSAISLSAEFGVSHSRPNSDPNKYLSKLFSEELVQSAFRMHSSNPSSHLRPVLPTLEGDLSLASAVDRLRLRKLAQRGATSNKDTLVSPAQISLREYVDAVKILTLPKNISNE